MASTALEQDKPAEAVRLCERAHSVFLRLLGEAHEYTVKAGARLAIARKLQAAGAGLTQDDAAAIDRLAALGFDKARYPTMLCMDADLQHEPESVPDVAEPVLNGDADFGVGSRNVGGGEVAGWTLSRKLISWGATLLARPLTPCTDPMSGFF